MLKRKARLLSVQARGKCEEIAQLKTGLASNRAAALLAVDLGASHSEVAKQVGITVGQVKYVVAVFRQKKLAIFPADLLETKVPARPETIQAKVQKVAIKEAKSAAKTKKEEKKKVKKGEVKTKTDKKLKKEKKVEVVKEKGKKTGKKKKEAAKAEKKSNKATPKNKSSKKKEKSKKSKKK